MKTKYFLMLMAACMMGVLSVNAQSKEPGKGPRKRMSYEQMSEMQGRKISQDLGLDDATSAKFMDLYKKYKEELRDAWKKDMPKKPDFKPGDGKQKPVLTDAEVDQMMKNHFKLSRKILDIREKYYDEFRKFLSPKQVQKVYENGHFDLDRSHKEMNRRADMKKKDGKFRDSK